MHIFLVFGFKGFFSRVHGYHCFKTKFWFITMRKILQYFGSVTKS